MRRRERELRVRVSHRPASSPDASARAPAWKELFRGAPRKCLDPLCLRCALEGDAKLTNAPPSSRCAARSAFPCLPCASAPPHRARIASRCLLRFELSTQSGKAPFLRRAARRLPRRAAGLSFSCAIRARAKRVATIIEYSGPINERKLCSARNPAGPLLTFHARVNSSGLFPHTAPFRDHFSNADVPFAPTTHHRSPQAPYRAELRVVSGR